MVEEDELRHSDLKRQELRRSVEKLKADSSGILTLIPQLKDLFEDNAMVEANFEKRTRELELKEKMLQRLSLDLEKRSKKFKAEKLMIEELAFAKEKRQKEIVVVETIHKSTSEMEERGKEIKAEETEAYDMILKSEIFRQEVVCKEKELNLVKNQIESEGKKLVQLEEETNSKKKDLALIVSSIEKRDRELESKEKELQSLNKKIEAGKAEADDLKKLGEECTQLRSTRNQLTVRLESMTKVKSELDSKYKQLRQVMAELGKRCNEARQVQDRKREMEEEIGRKMKELALVLVKIEEKRSREVELKEKELEKIGAELEMKADGLRKEIEEKGKELDLVKSQVKSWEEKLIQTKKLVDDSSKNVHGEVELKKKQLGHTKTVLLKHSGVEEEEEKLGLTLPVKAVQSSDAPKRFRDIYRYKRREKAQSPEEIKEKAK